MGHLVLFVVALFNLKSASSELFQSSDPCFCHSLGELHSCECTEKSVDVFNNVHIHGLLTKLLKKDCLRYYKTDMEKDCPFWQSNRYCTSRECGIENCDDEVPIAFKYTKYQVQDAYRSSRCDESNEIDPLDKTITAGQRRKLEKWTEHDERLDVYCDVEDESSEKLHYVDLVRNPERYTGYKGNSAQRVWKCIYEENCFKPDPKFDKEYLIYPNIRGMCSEKRMFYRIISGLHTSISISIAANSYKPAPGGMGEGEWFRNVDMFKYRFDPKYTNNEGPERLKNLYFVFLLEMRALQKISPYLHHTLFYTGNDEEDMDTMDDIKRLVDKIDAFGSTFSESKLFRGTGLKTRILKEEFRLHFLNISRIMDCVDCDKCRLWGKLQTHGIGTALKILFADLPSAQSGTSPKKRFQLQRNDVVALFNSIGRFSSSIREVAEFQKLLQSS
ncbi:Endoplasmic oxidoreductin-1 [Trichuris trichiura]|uniref:Endoplasmic oxidoreductin-1 n=1 Tax=Trichuris trichiura TaxID=36087 RepID=A0A077Z397_TRITR|nr:Endoplasmic oxidoreductin-1 [Trichuris trichiura]